MSAPDIMVERVARALAIAAGLDPDADFRAGDGITLSVATDKPEVWRTFVRPARAAIEAMPREVFVVIPDYGYDGYGEPEAAYASRELAEAHVKADGALSSLQIFEVPILDAALSPKAEET